ncbi:MAG TPA: hypothetical protein VI299_05570, partial [Polyangiales bacterium]
MRTRHGHALWGAVLLVACTNDPAIQGPEQDLFPGKVGDAGGPPTPPPAEEACRPVVGQSQPMRQQSLFSGSQALISPDEVFNRGFKENCGSCHVESSAFGFRVSDASELSAYIDDAITRIESNDAKLVMPPGRLLSERKAPDSVLDLLSLLKAWKAAGDSKLFADPRANGASSAALAASPELGKSFTNMGSCIPAARIVNSDATAMDALDAKFASLADNSQLPSKLSETDLVSLDSQVLARQGVISFAPGYTLWADDAKKMRYVRVPRGTSIAFSATKQDFTLPENTRFYKTFLKEVVDASGAVGYKKIETRIIVVRHAVETPGQPPIVKSLYGTYAWNEDETEATLEREPLRDGTPYKDHLIWYLTNEQQARDFIEDPGPDGLSAFEAIPEGASLADKREIAKPYLISRKAARHYALPGSERCLQCHQGSPDGSFVLGFTPLQIRRRPMGEGGVIEPATPDELNQLERFISYGLITGLDPTQIDRKVLKLEKSQGERDPRNEKELIAQGYMIGNCAHCHNPKGFATNSAPELRELLDFYPTPSGGGIFQFPLDRYSPRIFRQGIGTQGSAQNTTVTFRLPYITPSVYDNPLGAQPYNSSTPSSSKIELAAPWRSLIYRNVETPFAYSSQDDLAIYPHMPLNTPGFDPRAPRIMAEWMLSIDALPINPNVPEDVETADQNMREVVEGQRDLPYARVGTEVRLAQYRMGRGTYEVDTGDIIDSSVSPDDPLHLVPEAPGLIGIPGRPHFVELDLTDPVSTQYIPRNVAWNSALVQGDPNMDPAKAEDQARLVPILKNVRADEGLREFARKEVPLGLWKLQPNCKYPGQQKLEAFRNRTDFPYDAEWIAKPEDPARPVYQQPRGEAVFTMICSNCHGRNADSRGRQADSLLLLTGGGTRVANFRAGLFGPANDPGHNIDVTFAEAVNDQNTSRDWAMRYLAWMALGGTNRIIPTAILNVVSNGSVLGKGVNRGAAVSANMLSVARSVCNSLLPGDLNTTAESAYFERPAKSNATATSARVIAENGDADLWRSICTYENAAPIQGVTIEQLKGPRANLRIKQLFARDTYPVGAPVMDHRGKAQASLTSANLAPWCLLGANPALDPVAVQD